MLFRRFAVYIKLDLTMRHAKCEWCKQPISPASQYCAACGMPVPLLAKGGVGSISGGMGVLLIVAALLAIAALFLVFGSAAGVAMAGAALCIAIARLWWLRLPLRRYGAEISYSKRPVAYNLCVATLFCFSLLFLFTGVFAVVAGVK